MFYFVNKYFLSTNSSAEHAEIKRLKLFHRNQTAAKLVTFDFDNIIHATLRRFGLEDQQLVNLYDFFAGTTDYQGHEMHTPDLHLAYDYQVGTGNDSREVKDGDRLVAQVFFIGGTIGQIDHVDYYDQTGNLTLSQKYDIRGFKAVDQFFGNSGENYYERYYRPDGQCYLEKYYVQSTQNTPINSLNVLHNYKGKDWYFDGPDHLQMFFLNQLNESSAEGNNVFIADRPGPIANVVRGLDNPQTRKYLSIPFNHMLPGQDPVKGKMNFLIDQAAQDWSMWDGIIVDTQDQKRDLEKRFGQKVKVFAVNASPVAHVVKQVPMGKRPAKQVLYVGRLAEDKGVGNLIKIFTKVHKKVADSKLFIYGYGTAKDTEHYHDLVKQAKLTDSILFAGYHPNLDSTYDSVDLFVDAAMIDAEPLATAEALEHGVPVVSYNYSYGPAEMIKSGVNGELIPTGDQQKMVKTIVDLLQNPQKLQKLSQAAYDNLGSLDYQSTWQQWQTVINDHQ